MIRTRIKIIALYACKYAGLFKLAMLITKNKFRILCYHGFSYADEHLFRPKLFMRPETLRKRLETISRMGFQVYPLTEFLAHQRENTIPDFGMAITVDDGWIGTRKFAFPMFREFDFPWTLYLTTYYVEKGTQVTNIAIQYLLWKTQVKSLNLAQVVPGENRVVDISSHEQQQEIYSLLNDYCNQIETSDLRQQFIEGLASILEVETAADSERNLFCLSTAGELKEMASEQVDIQLHTHRHRMPEESEQSLVQELEQNRESIRRLCALDANHLCYPSGFYTEKQIEWLKRYGIESGVTCEPGLNTATTGKLRLKRFLDGEDLHQIEFEAEVSGFKHIAHIFLKRIKNIKGPGEQHVWGT